MPKNILLIGATGGIGLWVAHNLLETEHKITVICRNPKKLETIFKGKTFENVITMDIFEEVSKFDKKK